MTDQPEPDTLAERLRAEAKFPNIGKDPLKTDGEERQKYMSIGATRERLNEARSVQQSGVPDQTALVWRIDISTVLDELSVESARATARKELLEAKDREIAKAHEANMGLDTAIGEFQEEVAQGFAWLRDQVYEKQKAKNHKIEALDREALGKKVREVWVTWAKEQKNPKPHWLTPWEELTETDKEVDRRIGETLAQHKLAYEQDPEMAFDDELGWLHKDSLVVVNELRAEVEQFWKQAAGTLQTISWSGFGVEYERGWNNAVRHNQKVLLAKTGDPNAKAELGMMPTTAERDLIRKCVTLLQQFLQPDTTIRDQIDYVREVKAVLSTASSLGINPSSLKTSSS